MNKAAIRSALSAIPTGDFLEKSKSLLAALGYKSQRTLALSGAVHAFFQAFPPPNPHTKLDILKHPWVGAVSNPSAAKCPITAKSYDKTQGNRYEFRDTN